MRFPLSNFQSPAYIVSTILVCAETSPSPRFQAPAPRDVRDTCKRRLDNPAPPWKLGTDKGFTPEFPQFLIPYGIPQTRGGPLRRPGCPPARRRRKGGSGGEAGPPPAGHLVFPTRAPAPSGSSPRHCFSPQRPHGSQTRDYNPGGGDSHAPPIAGKTTLQPSFRGATPPFPTPDRSAQPIATSAPLPHGAAESFPGPCSPSPAKLGVPPAPTCASTGYRPTGQYSRRAASSGLATAPAAIARSCGGDLGKRVDSGAPIILYKSYDPGLQSADQRSNDRPISLPNQSPPGTRRKDISKPKRPSRAPALNFSNCGHPTSPNSPLIPTFSLLSQCRKRSKKKPTKNPKL